MDTSASLLVTDSARVLLRELLYGPAPDAVWVLDPGDTGLVGSLAALSAEQASTRPIPARASPAALANHIGYHLELLNRAIGGENAFATADWPGSWRVQIDSEDEWQALLSALRAQADRWLAALKVEREWDSISLTGTLASAAHIAYHLGALRQVVSLL